MADSGITYAEKFYEISHWCQFHKTFFSIIYAPNSTTLSQNSMQYTDSGINYAEKFIKLAIGLPT